MVGRRSNEARHQKRQRPQNVKPFTKRRKTEVITEPNETPDQMKITGMNDDCLEHIFKQLKLIDLLNVADSRKSLKDGIDQAFRSKYGKCHVHINIGVRRMEIYEDKNTIEIYDFGSSLKFLRCFGKFTSALKIHNTMYARGQQKRRRELDRYMNEHCTETLKKLTISDALKCAIAGVKQPFTNVEKLRIDGRLGRKLSNFNRWFPKLKHLKLYTRSVTDSQCIEVHLPHLKSLGIDKFYGFQLENILNCFRLNSQLQTLRIKKLYTPNVLKSASEELPHLEKLYVESASCFDDMNEIIHFKNVKKFGLGDRLPSKIPLSFRKIEHFSLKLIYYTYDLSSNQAIKQFISTHQSIKTMDIKFRFKYKTDDIKKELMKTWSFEDGWNASFKFEDDWHKIKFKRNN